MKSKLQCILCQTDLVGPRLELGKLPPCNRFAAVPEVSTPTYPLALTECSHCSLIQLFDPPPIEALIPQVPWIRYNEPDAHLEAVTSQLLPQLKAPASVFGIGPFDQPLLKKLAAQGLTCKMLDLFALEPKRAIETFPYLETLQARLHPQPMQTLATTHGKSQLLICRYLLEHCRDPLAALDSFRPLLAENGLVLIEVPDSSKFLTRKDYSFIWEEHVCYFTAESFTRLLRQAGYRLFNLMRFEGQLEDALVALVQPLPQTAAPSPMVKEKAPSLFTPYAAAFEKVRDAYQTALAAIQAQGGKIAILGAGHQALMFMHALGLQDFVSYLVDDDANKQAYFTPGAHLPIVSSEKMLADDKINTCLLAVSPRIETKIQEKCAAFLARGGKMYSIFPGSKLYQSPSPQLRYGEDRAEEDKFRCTL